MEYPIYDITFDPKSDIGMTAISFVDEPAICQDFIYYKKGEAERPSETQAGSIIMANAEKREIISPILIPNQLILRADETGRYYNRWTKEVIEKIANHYILSQNSNNFTIMHSWFNGEEQKEYEDTFVKDVYMLRMWIIDDPKNDEANKKYGYHLPEGTLMVHLKVHNRQLWQRIKSGELRGLSIEAFVPQVFTENIKYNKLDKKEENMANFDVDSKMARMFSKFMVWYNQTVQDAEALADMTSTDATESGEVTVKYYTTETDYIEIFADGTAKTNLGEDLQDGEYALYDGNLLVIVDGKYSETRAKEDSVDNVPEEAPIAEEKCDGGEEEKEEEAQEEVTEEDKKEEETSEEDVEVEKEEETSEEASEEDVEVEAPYTLVPVDVDGVEFQVPIEVADYIKTLEDARGMAESFRKEIARYQSLMPSVKPVGEVVKQDAKEEDKEDKFAMGAASLFRILNRKN